MAFILQLSVYPTIRWCKYKEECAMVSEESSAAITESNKAFTFLKEHSPQKQSQIIKEKGLMFKRLLKVQKGQHGKTFAIQ